MNGQGDQMPTKKKTGKGEGRSRNSEAGKARAKTAPGDAPQASAEDRTRATRAPEQANTAPDSRRSGGARAEKPSAKRSSGAKPSTSGARRRPDPVGAVLSADRPTRGQIADRAYELFVRSGYQHGHSEEHWLQAERELEQEFGAKKHAPRKPPAAFSSV